MTLTILKMMLTVFLSQPSLVRPGDPNPVDLSLGLVTASTVGFLQTMLKRRQNKKKTTAMSEAHGDAYGANPKWILVVVIRPRLWRMCTLLPIRHREHASVHKQGCTRVVIGDRGTHSRKHV